MHIFLITCYFGIVATDLVVHTNNGPLQGVSSLAEDVEAFFGIPYAEPPVGDLRFSKPVPKGKWTDIYNASNLPPPCSQFALEHRYYFAPDISNMSEDCLYLNIWTPRSNSTDKLKPVIIFIHPGGFVTGSASMEVHDGSHLASRGDLVVATINYRLGTLGFFLAFIEEADGNMGMFDQILAIKWIKENAKYFGGDPENVVLMGASAGSLSISAHMISPLSKDLFKRAITQSGSILIPLVMDNNTQLFKNSQLVANIVGCSNETTSLESDPLTVVKCMKSKPKEVFAEAEKTIFQSKPGVFFPRVNDEFLPKRNIVDFFREGQFREDMEVMTGLSSDEGTLLLMAAIPEYFGNYGRNYENNMNKIRALTIGRGMLISMEQKNSSEIAKFYLSQVKNHVALEYTKMVANILGDFVINCGTLFLADFVSAKGNPVYFYKFNFRPASTPLEEWLGATHLDELQYVFGNPYHDNFTAEEIELSHLLMDRWSAFAKRGNPNIPGHMPWLPYSYDTPVYLNFGQEEESIRTRPNDRCEIWRERFNSQLDSELNEFPQNSEPNTTDISVEKIPTSHMLRIKGGLFRN